MVSPSTGEASLRRHRRSSHAGRRGCHRSPLPSPTKRLANQELSSAVPEVHPGPRRIPLLPRVREREYLVSLLPHPMATCCRDPRTQCSRANRYAPPMCQLGSAQVPIDDGSFISSELYCAQTPALRSSCFGSRKSNPATARARTKRIFSCICEMRRFPLIHLLQIELRQAAVASQRHLELCIR